MAAVGPPAPRATPTRGSSLLLSGVAAVAAVALLQIAPQHCKKTTQICRRQTIWIAAPAAEQEEEEPWPPSVHQHGRCPPY